MEGPFGALTRALSRGIFATAERIGVLMKERSENV